MAQRHLSLAIGEAIVSALELGLPTAARHIERWLRTVGHAVRPDPAMTIRTTDGAAPTGVLVVDRGRVLLFAGIREAASTGMPAPPRRPSFDDDLCFEDSVYRPWPR